MKNLIAALFIILMGTLYLAGCRTDNVVMPIAAATPDRFVVLSDPQYPRYLSSSDSPWMSASLITQQFVAAARYAGSNPTFINGDMTEFGHGGEIHKVKLLLKSSGLQNYWFGLGNHDYSNNVGDCANNGCASNSMHWLISQFGEGVSADYRYRKIDGAKIHDGSFAYSRNFGVLHYVQLNNYPTYTTYIKSSVTQWRVGDALAWLETDLRQAWMEGKVIILGIHQPNGWSSPEFLKIIEKYGVTAIFTGDLHTLAVMSGPTMKKHSRFGYVPTFVSGWASDKTFIVSEFTSDMKTLNVYSVSNNDVNAKVLMSSVRVKRRSDSPVIGDRDNVSSSGMWGDWAPDFTNCGPGQIVTGVQVKSEKYQGSGDDSSLNAVRLLCSGGALLRSSEGPWGEDSTIKSCPAGSGVVGFRLNIEEYQGSSGKDDDTGANEIELYCATAAGVGKGTILGGSSALFGTWRSMFTCPSQQFVTGFRTRVEANQGGNDDSALNGVQMYCASATQGVMVPAQGSTASDGFWGAWGQPESCSPGSAINGFVLKSEAPTPNDNSAINGIRMTCSSFEQQISSLEGRWGKVLDPVSCPGGQFDYAVGFRLKLEENGGYGFDDSAVNNLELICASGGRAVGNSQTAWGTWRTEFRCPAGKVATGFVTRVEPDLGGNDDSALNGMRLFCSDISAAVAVPAQADADADGYWGDWSPQYSECEPGAKIDGFGLVSENSAYDNSALNAIRMHCSGPQQNESIRNLEGIWGSASAMQLCPGSNNYMVGFALRITAKGAADETAATNMQMICKDDSKLTGVVPRELGTWRKAFTCPAGYAATGFKTRVERNLGTRDDSALNGLKLLCRKQ
ncbi:MAG: metallophosphoesterase [Janthinobacterium lividum]